MALVALAAHHVPLDLHQTHVYHRPQLVPLLRLDVHVPLLVLLADRPVVSVVAHTVHLLEGELLVFVLIGNHSNHYVVILDQDDPDVEVETSFLGQCLKVVQLVGWAVKLLNLVSCGQKLILMLCILVQLEYQLLPELLKFLLLL